MSIKDNATCYNNSINLFNRIINRILTTNAEITGIYAPAKPIYKNDIPVIFVVNADNTIDKIAIDEIKTYNSFINETDSRNRLKHKINYNEFNYTNELKSLKEYFNRRK